MVVITVDKQLPKRVGRERESERKRETGEKRARERDREKEIKKLTEFAMVIKFADL